VEIQPVDVPLGDGADCLCESCIQLVGGPHRDAADLTHGVRPHQCAVCGTDRDLIVLPAIGPPHILTLMPLGPPPHCICPSCDRAVMHRIAAPSHPGSVVACSGRGCTSPFSVVAIWPRNSQHYQGQLSIRACPQHLADAIVAQAAEHAAASTPENPS
jgi:hypothetical protein